MMTLKALAHNCQTFCQHSIGQQAHAKSSISRVGKHAWSIVVGGTATSRGEQGGRVTPLWWSEAQENLEN